MIQSLETSELREIISFWDVNICVAIVSQNRPIIISVKNLSCRLSLWNALGTFVPVTWWAHAYASVLCMTICLLKFLNLPLLSFTLIYSSPDFLYLSYNDMTFSLTTAPLTTTHPVSHLPAIDTMPFPPFWANSMMTHTRMCCPWYNSGLSASLDLVFTFPDQLPVHWHCSGIQLRHCSLLFLMHSTGLLSLTEASLPFFLPPT